MTTARIGVLFVCYANMCRSPLAEGVFRHLVAERGLEHRFDIDSAGTSAAPGAAPHPLSVDIGHKHGIEVSGSARTVVPDDLYRFHHVIAMDRQNAHELDRLVRLSGFGPVVGAERLATIRLLRQLERPRARGADLDVPDPIAGGPDHYARVFQLIRAGCTALIDELAPAPAADPPNG